jgi:hypothetical protein
LVDLLQINPEYRRKIFETTLESVGLKEIERLVQQYKLIDERMEYLLPYEKNLDSDNPLDIFLFDISCGSYPPPEIIMMLAKCFNLYFLAEGKLTLEEVFFGKRIKKSGNYSRRKARNNSFKEFHYQVIKEKGNSKYIGPKFNLEEFTLSYLKTCEENEVQFPIANVTEANIESFIANYYRWKNQNSNNQTSLIDQEKIKNDSIIDLYLRGYSKLEAKNIILKVFNNKLTEEETIKKALLLLNSRTNK